MPLSLRLRSDRLMDDRDYRMSPDFRYDSCGQERFGTAGTNDDVRFFLMFRWTVQLLKPSFPVRGRSFLSLTLRLGRR